MFCGLANAESLLPKCEGSNHTKWTDCFRGAKFTDGKIYIGEWKDGQFHGKGKLTFPDGSVEIGGFKYHKLEWQIDYRYKKFLKGIWTINQPMDSFLNESESGHNFVDEEIYFFNANIGFVNADYVCQILSTNPLFIPSKNSKKFGVKGNSFVVHKTNCKNNEKKFGFDNIFIANKGSLVLFQYSTDFEEPFDTFPFKIGGPSPYLNSFERDELKFVQINNVTREIDENKYLGQFRHKFISLDQKEIIFKESTLPACQGNDYEQWNNCYGMIRFPDGNKYIGEVYNGNAHGQGIYVYTNGEEYIGSFKDGKRHGRGTYTYANEDKYVGEYKDGKWHGQGTYTWASGEFAGDKYVGEHKDGYRHGLGTYTLSNGDKYVGGWKDGKEHGQGTYTWASGSKYVGEHKDGEEHGQGIFTRTDGTIKKGIWEKGKLIKKQTASSTEINNAILKCADYEYTKDMKQNFFKYMYESVTQKTDVTNWNKVNKSLNLRISPSDYLYQLIIDLTKAGYNKQEISIFLKNKLENRTSDFESLEEKDKLLILSIRQQQDSWIESLNLFLRKTPVEKRKYDDYGVWFLTCESRSKKDVDSFVEKYSNIN